MISRNYRLRGPAVDAAAARQPEDRRAEKGAPLLTLILCSRNDEYMGNSRWRLQAALNYAALQLSALGRAGDAEILVADWGSEPGLSDTIQLSPEAAELVSFILIPPHTAREVQGESSFPEVLALNAVARRARGEYIGRIDQDTLVGSRFLRWFFDACAATASDDNELRRSLIFSNRREIPYRVAVQCPRLGDLDRFVRSHASSLRVGILPDRPFWTYWVGIWMAHRELWSECGGYDERLVHYNWMETEMIIRLRERYPVIDAGSITGYDFYHLGHLKPALSAGRVHLRTNAPLDITRARNAHPNDSNWGMAGHALPKSRSTRRPCGSTPGSPASYAMLLLKAAFGTAGDRIRINMERTIRAVSRRLRRPGQTPRAIEQ